MTLKIGDRVKVRPEQRHYSAHPRLRPGVEYRVTQVLENCAWLDGYNGGFVSEGRLEKIEPEPKFKAGDRAECSFGGGTVTILDVGAHEQWPIQAKYADGKVGLWKVSELKPVDAQPRPLGLQAGDKVVNLKTGREGLVLKGPISGELKVYDQRPPIKTAVPAQALEEYEFHYPGTYDVWRRVTEKKKAQPW